MTHLVRLATIEDLQPLYEMAKLTGGGFTNLPADKAALASKLERSAAAATAASVDDTDDHLFVLVLEDSASGEVRGTAQIFTAVGRRSPFYSYRLGTLTQSSRELNRTFRADMLTLTTDLEGSSEVGGLFLHPSERAGGLGMLLARSRYLFIRQHRALFAERVIAELRGVIDEAGGSPFWDGLAGRFFGMSFQEADAFNAVHGHQFIADLMPKHPIYIAMLPETARAVIGIPHMTGRAAMRMLETEGFQFENYVDIFDGGPTMIAATNRIASIAAAEEVTLTAIGAGAGEQRLVSTGRLADFRAAYARIDGSAAGVTIDADAARLLGVAAGDTVLHAPR